MMKILINDRNTYLTEGMKALYAVSDFSCGKINGFSEAAQLIRKYTGIILLTELVTPDENFESALSFLQRTSFLYSRIRIIILTEIEDTSVLGLVRKLFPAITLLQKTAPLTQIQKAIEAAVTAINEGPPSRYAFTPPHSAIHLTLRELRMMKWFGAGLSLNDIGSRVTLSPKTVSHYRRSVYTKLSCESEAHFVSKLRQLGFSGR